MTPGAKLNIGLAVVLVALMAVALVTTRSIEEETRRLADIELETVGTIRVERAGGPPVVIERDGEDWVMREPLAVDVEARRVVDLVESFNVPSHAQYSITEISPDLGLGNGDSPPLAHVTIDEAVFVIGKTAPITDWRYVRVGDEVHLVTDIVYHRIQGDAYSWARRQPLPSGSRIARIEFDDFAVVRADPGWTLEPEGDAVSADALQKLVDAWANAQAFQVARYDGDGVFDHVVRISLDGIESPLVFGLIGGESATTLVREDPGLEYRLPAYDTEAMVTLDRTEPATPANGRD